MKTDRYFGISKRIFPWKETSEFENALAEAAGESSVAKGLYAKYYKHLDEAYFGGAFSCTQIV